MKSIIIKLSHWEYWPTQVVYFPIYLYHKLLAIRARSYFFFSNVNPDMEMGGLFFASKFKALQQLPQAYKPKTILIQSSSGIEKICADLLASEIGFPCIAKPDRLERGLGVQILANPEFLMDYQSKYPYDFVIQELIEYPFEAGIFFWRNHDGSLEIPSIVTKEFLSITGDGATSLKSFVKSNERAFLHAKKLKNQYPQYWETPIPKDLNLILEPIGNHSRGTKFLDGRNLYNVHIQQATERLCMHLPNYHYGRIDLRCPTLEDFISGNHYKVLEINGVNAEPAHIYQPGFSIWKAWATLFKHWNKLYTLSISQKQRGYTPISFWQGAQLYRAYKKASKILKVHRKEQPFPSSINHIQ